MFDFSISSILIDVSLFVNKKIFVFKFTHYSLSVLSRQTCSHTHVCVCVCVCVVLLTIYRACAIYGEIVINIRDITGADVKSIDNRNHKCMEIVSVTLFLLEDRKKQRLAVIMQC